MEDLTKEKLRDVGTLLVAIAAIGGALLISPLLLLVALIALGIREILFHRAQRRWRNK